MDAVYRVRRAGSNEELRYSLRSVSAFLPVERVWIVGWCPPWATNVEHIPSNPRGWLYARSLAHLRAAADHPEVSEEFVMFDDDFFVLRPIERPPTAHMGPISAVLPAKRDTSYRKHLDAARRTLEDWGYRDPLCYELHIPMCMTKTGVREVVERAAADVAIGSGIRSVYGNVMGIGGERMDDVKVGAMRVAVDLDERAFVSTSDSSFRGGLVGDALRRRFPNPSPYEG